MLVMVMSSMLMLVCMRHRRTTRRVRIRTRTREQYRLFATLATTARVGVIPEIPLVERLNLVDSVNERNAEVVDGTYSAERRECRLRWRICQRILEELQTIPVTNKEDGTQQT